MHDALLVKICAHVSFRSRETRAYVVELRSPRKRGAVTQESGGGARESGRVRSAASDERCTIVGAHLTPCPSRIRMTVDGLRASGAERKRWNAQSAGWMRAHPGVECDSMCAGPDASPIRASAHAAAAGTLNCSSVRTRRGVRTHNERFRIGGILLDTIRS